MIHAKIREQIAGFWSEDINLSGKAIFDLLKQEPIKHPSLRFVQGEVKKLNKGKMKLEPQSELPLWQHEWYEDPMWREPERWDWDAECTDSDRTDFDADLENPLRVAVSRPRVPWPRP